jgi:hypothetical protein
MGTQLVKISRKLVTVFIEEVQDYKFLKQNSRNQTSIPQLENPQSENTYRAVNNSVLTLD